MVKDPCNWLKPFHMKKETFNANNVQRSYTKSISCFIYSEPALRKYLFLCGILCVICSMSYSALSYFDNLLLHYGQQKAKEITYCWYFETSVLQESITLLNNSSFLFYVEVSSERIVANWTTPLIRNQKLGNKMRRKINATHYWKRDALL